MGPQSSRREFLQSAGALAGTFSLTSTFQKDVSAHPNIVLFFIDDLGYADIEPFGSRKNRTPHLSRMADEGMKLTSFYSAASLCSPSRAALMTGCYPRRVGLEKGNWYGVLVPGDAHGINEREVTLPEILKRAGYKTACIGKWHLGDQPQFLPTNHGFDYYFGIPYSNDMWPLYKRWNFPPLPLLRNEEIVGAIESMDDQARLTGEITREAEAFIRDNKSNPFFLYVPHAMVHWPHAAAQAFAENSANDLYRAAVEEIDWSVGRLLQLIEDLSLDENTLFLFTSDNGGDRSADNRPLKGYKGSTWEGGMRVPAIVRWPGRIRASSVCDQLASTMDLLPTFAGLAGLQTPSDRVIDGKDFSDLLLGREGAKSKYEAFFYELEAVRSGKWKYFGDGRLYNLAQDIGETRNVACNNPGVVASLRERLEEGRRDLTTNCRAPGKAEGPLRFLIPRPGETDTERHSPVRILDSSPG